jgi:hypothetical protein
MKKAYNKGPMSYNDYYVLKHHCKDKTCPSHPVIDPPICPEHSPLQPPVDLCQPTTKDKIYDIMAKRTLPTQQCKPKKPSPCQPYCMCNSKVENECYCRNIR